jgi:potassium/hydrogen antiporter
MIPMTSLFLVVAILLLLSVLASKASSRIGIPSLVLFIMIGMLAGSDGIGGIKFNNPAIVQTLGVIALIFILFSAGFDTHSAFARPVLWQGLGLATFGVIITAFLIAIFAYYVIPMPFIHSLLLGAIVSSTDASAVFSILRSKQVTMNSHLKILTEFESGSNDPMSIFLTLACIKFILTQNISVFDLLLMFFSQLIVGLLVGFSMGKLIPYIFNKLKLEYGGLYPVLNVALLLLTYGVSSSLDGSGFLAIYLTGLMMAKAEFHQKNNLYRFHDGFVWLMQIIMFLILGLQILPSQLPSVLSIGILVAAFLIIIARPVAVFSVLSFSALSFREKTMVAWTGLRGAVPIILATFPLIAQIPQANIIFNIVFFIVLTSVLIQGTLLTRVARFLKVNH